MRILLAPAGTRGDFQPQLALALALKRRGHAVTMVASPPFAARCAALDIPFVPLGLDIQAWMDEHGKDVGSNLPRALKAFNAVLGDQVTVQFEGLHALTANADLLVGAGLQFAGASVCAARNIPYRYVAYAPSILVSRFHPPPIVPLLRFPSSLNRAAWWMFEAFYNRLVLARCNTQREKLGLPPLASFWGQAVTSQPLLAWDAALAPIPADAPPAAVVTGSWHVPDGQPLDERLETFLRAGERPVVFGLGSMTDAHAAETTRQVVGACRDEGKRLVLLGGWAGYGKDLTGDDVLVVSEAPHLSLYPRAAFVIHHGGAGAVAAAARSGVPQMAVAHLGDQFQWANALFDAGVSPPPFARRGMTQQKLREALRWMTSHPEATARAAQLGETVRASRGVEAAVDELERVAQPSSPVQTNTPAKTAISDDDTAAIQRFSSLLELVTRFSYATYSVHVGPAAASSLLMDALASAPAEPEDKHRAWLDEALRDWTVDDLHKSANVDGGLSRGLETLKQKGSSREDYEAALEQYRASLRRISSDATQTRRADVNGTIYRFMCVSGQWFYFTVHCDAHLD